MSAPSRIMVSLISRKLLNLCSPSGAIIRCKRCSQALMRSQMRRMIMTSCVLKNRESSSDSSSSSDDSSSDDSDSEVDPKLSRAVKSVASSLPGDPKRTESDLLGQLRALSKPGERKGDSDDSKRASQAGQSLGDLFAGMRIKLQGQDSMEGPRNKYDERFRRPPNNLDQDREDPGQFRIKDVQRHQADVRRRAQQMQVLAAEPEKLFQGPRLNIFSKKEKITEMTDTESKEETLWDIIDKEELEMHRPPPNNAFEEMIKWTEEGKLWKFPIDNEAGMEEENNTEFHEHVFLERHIEDFPKRGPIRHFMDLVLTGLSKNPYMTAQMKREHIDWFRQYFKDKKEIIKENIGQDSLIQDTIEQ